MNQNKLPKITSRRRKRVGRGYGSGKGGHTSSRGAKGQKARGKVKIWFEGGQLALVRRLPKTRGKGRFKPLKASPVIVNLKDLMQFEKNSEITEKVLIGKGIVTAEEVHKYGVKILGDGKLAHPLTVKVSISKSAAKKIEKVGGKVEQNS